MMPIRSIRIKRNHRIFGMRCALRKLNSPDFDIMFEIQRPSKKPLVISQICLIAACGRVEPGGTMKYETVFNRPSPTRLACGRLGHPTPADRGGARGLLSTIKRYVRQRRETGPLTAKPIPGRPPKKGATLDAKLPAQLAAHDDATLEQHCQLWEASHGVQVSTASMSRAIVDWAGREKKTDGCHRAGRKRPCGVTRPDPVSPSRALGLCRRMWDHIALTPLYARAPCGQRAYGAVPCNRGANTTLIAGLSLCGMQAPFILEGAVDTLAFEAYVEQGLGPEPAPGEVVVLDNVNVAYRRTGRVRPSAREGVRRSGCRPTPPT